MSPEHHRQTSVVGPRPLEAGGGMALLALLTEPAGMHIVFRVAGAADHRRLDDILGLQVALVAPDRGVCSRQRKSRPRGMVEVPELPAIGRMAGGAGFR